MEPLIQQETIKYKTWVKEALRQALSTVFAAHPDDILKDNTNVVIDFPIEEVHYPAVVVRFYEREIKNAGIAHLEHIEDVNNLGTYIKYQQSLYNGDIEFAVYALSSTDRDLISDALVQTIRFAPMEAYTNQFLQHIYAPTSVPSENEGGAYDPSMDHMVNLNTDVVRGFGESQTIAPWLPEDVLVYQTSYRIGIFGQFYSRTPVNFNYGLVEHVEQYPYNSSAGEPIPNPNPEDPTPWEGYPDPI